MADILRQNKIPGREQLTRPSEIGALSKYLGNIKKVQEEHTELEDRVLEVKGRGDKAYFPSLDSLDNSVETLENTSSGVSLDESITKLPGHLQDKLKLDETIVKTNVSNPVKDLDNRISETPGSRPNIDSLDDSVVKNEAGDKEKLKNLDDSILKLRPEEKITGLDNTVIKQNPGTTIKDLDNSIKNLEIKDTIEKLDDSVTGLSINQKVQSLRNSTENLNVQEKIKDLDKEIVRGNFENKVKELSTKVEKIQVNENLKLDNTIEDLYVENTLDSLDNTVVERTSNFNTDIDSLGNTVVERASNFNSDLENLDSTVIKRTSNFNPELKNLGTYVSELSDVEPIDDLDNSIKKLEVKGTIDSLKNFREDLKNTPLITELDDDISELDIDGKIDKIVKDLRDDVADLEIEAKVDELINSALKRPMDKKFTEAKNALDQAEQQGQSIEKAFNTVIKLLDDYKNESSSPWVVDKIKSILTDAIFSSPIDRPFAGYDSTARSRYSVFMNKLEEAVNIAEVSLWESSKKQNRIGEVGEIKKVRKKEDAEIIPSYTLPDYRLPKINKDSTVSSVISDLTSGNLSVNGMDYARFSIEKGLSDVRGSLKMHLLKESLRAVNYLRDLGERTLGINPGRLPGSPINDSSVTSAARSIVKTLKTTAVLLNDTNALHSKLRNSITALVDLTLAKNRPKAITTKDGKTEKVPTKNYQAANNRKRKIDSDSLAITYKLLSNIKSDFDPTLQSVEIVDSDYINFAKNYMYSEGIQTTLMDLCNISSSSLPSSFEELQKILRESPYITTPGKFGNTNYSENRAQTLAVTNYWEILLEPFVNTEMNGGFSYLPAIQEINLINQKKHGVNTGYNAWIPFTGFDMTLSKLNTKSVGLYDGEIVYPISNELTNELRITIADDIYKSWNWYFKTVTDVSVYSSVPHNKYYYTGQSLKYPIAPTYVDKTCPCVALYKNITFRIRIFIMTPQYSTIKSFDLLCVLKDWTENYVGDVDSAGSGDISLSFSVVGENPDKYVPPVNLVDVTNCGLGNSWDRPEDDVTTEKDFTVIDSKVNFSQEGSNTISKKVPENTITPPSTIEGNDGVIE